MARTTVAPSAHGKDSNAGLSLIEIYDFLRNSAQRFFCAAAILARAAALSSRFFLGFFSFTVAEAAAGAAPV